MAFFTVVSYKGGVTKTTTAVHLAAFLQRLAPTLLIDGDPNRGASVTWAEGGGLPFTIVDANKGAYEARHYEHVVIDTEARPGSADLKTLAEGCDFMVIPAVPAKLETAALKLTIDAARANGLPDSKFRVLLTKVPPPPETDGPDLRRELEAAGIPTFVSEVPRLKVFEHAVAAGVPVYGLKGRFAADAKRGWDAYEAAWHEIDQLALAIGSPAKVQSHG
jgi:chromosome partitioning protein